LSAGVPVGPEERARKGGDADVEGDEERDPADHRRFGAGDREWAEEDLAVEDQPEPRMTSGATVTPAMQSA
jgi:hypothetical protein